VLGRTKAFFDGRVRPIDILTNNIINLKKLIRNGRINDGDTANLRDIGFIQSKLGFSDVSKGDYIR